MNEIESKLEQNRAEQEKLKEEEVRLQAELDNPTHKHGDYWVGIDDSGMIYIQPKDCWPEQSSPIWIYPDGSWGYADMWHGNIKTKLPNIYDDLERNSVDLRKFHGYYAGESDSCKASMRVILEDNQWIQFKIGNAFFTTDLAETIKIHRNLGQLLATAERHK